MDNANTLVTVFGGSGFVGTQLVQVLAKKGFRIRVAVRRPDLAGHVRMLGSVGQVTPIQANVRNADSVVRAVAGANVVVNLVGIGFERGPNRFRAVHVMGAKNVAEAAKAAGVEKLVHLSALGADTESPSAYLRTKALGEEAVAAAYPDAQIVRAQMIFGQDDTFFNKLGTMARFFPILPVVGAKSRFQPVYVGDVADAIGALIGGAGKPGKVYELGGPEVRTVRELYERVLRDANRRNPLVPVPTGVAKLLAVPFSILWFDPLVTGDQVEMLGADGVVSDAAIKEKRTLSGLGVEPTAMGAVLPAYLWRFRRNGQFDRQPA
ncbi:MAG TPA: complex I NDUFA9 subunit family protein [Devosia sp.]|nr:complex I NDUFA9 subunit family protein [Devosia sp.]